MKRLIVLLMCLFVVGCVSGPEITNTINDFDGKWVGEGKGMYGKTDMEFRIKNGIIDGTVVRSPVESRITGHVDDKGIHIKRIWFWKSQVNFRITKVTSDFIGGVWEQEKATGTWFVKKK